jgi:hypothetical protein
MIPYQQRKWAPISDLDIVPARVRSKMKPFQIMLLFVVATTTILCSAQNTSSIVIRLLNGKNGKPIIDKQLNVRLGTSGTISRDPDSQGEIVLDILNVEPRELRVRPNNDFDCRFKQDQMGPGGLDLKYSLDEIISKGIVGITIAARRRYCPLRAYLRYTCARELSWRG